jgi:hypothetical protein
LEIPLQECSRPFIQTVLRILPHKAMQPYVAGNRLKKAMQEGAFIFELPPAIWFTVKSKEAL